MSLQDLPDEARKGVAAIALFGLTSALIEPPSLPIFTEAQRIIFAESDEFKKIADLLSMDVSILRKNVFHYLEKNGVRCEGKNYR